MQQQKSRFTYQQDQANFMAKLAYIPQKKSPIDTNQKGT